MRTIINFSRRAGRLPLPCVTLLALLPCAFVLSLQLEAWASNIIHTKHNLSVSGPGPIQSHTEDRVCVFCHTPHNAYRLNSAIGGSGPIAPNEYTYLPLWGHQVTLQPETGVYSSSTLKAHLPLQPTGPTKLCLSCHDGTVAIGAVASGANLGITTQMGDPPANPQSNIGTNLSSHHPVSFPYSDSLPNPELQNIGNLPTSVSLWGNKELHCSTCHDPHDDSHLDASGNYGNFLVMDNNSSQLCEACHLLTAWRVAAHNQCEDCHAPHFAYQGEWLLNFNSSNENACLGVGCHGATNIIHSTAAGVSRTVNSMPHISQSAASPTVDISRQIQKVSSHRTTGNTRILSQRQQLAQRRSGMNDVTCVGCHNPHSVNRKKASAPYASGMLQGVSGIDRNGLDVSAVTYEYEVCFKCHSDYEPAPVSIPRVVGTTNTRLAFNVSNPSYHPVIGMGKNLNIPSIPSSYEPSLASSSVIYCTDCHRDDSGGSKGPHGSSFAPILRERYETHDNTTENYQNYALCYRCHNRDSILIDASFRRKLLKTTATGGGHSGHLAKGAPCSACHDPHGVYLTSSLALAATGSHTHLINFDASIVLPKQGSKYPVFIDNGTFSGSCTLVCHGKLHDNLSYP